MSYRRPVLFSVAAGIAGFLLNLYPVPIFTGVPFSFGNALYLCTGILLGPLYGLLTALIANVPIMTFSAPLLLLFCSVESVTVAWAVRRHSIPAVAATFVFRLCAILPWAIVTFSHGFG